ncbi:hypothetical protein BZARG_2560 [Bizionia argentinensis JUB59]|uniref:DUF3558 domain-containing protein n=1 Tax=Bizionia argentinensis JUB59 TaxID=1046627 RepID=G2EGU3_9FLAO|nr:hypothetical protein [Bizionia argentinensis]EGV42356.1 hypothetical protein BZARG_2560 [Bizionia argentinensis JUB59]
MKKLIFLLVTIIGTIACGNSEKKNSTSGKSAALSPCEILTEAEIKNALSIPAETETTMNEKNTTYPSCYYKWKSITWEYEVMPGHMADYSAELSIVMVDHVNKEKYETSISFYKDGQAENGIGDMATWGEKKTQLTFLHNGTLFHVHCRTSNDATSNKVKTIKIAKLIINKL